MKLPKDPIGSFFKMLDEYDKKLRAWHPHFAILAEVAPGDWRFLEKVERRRVERMTVLGNGRFAQRVVTEYRALKA